MATSSISDESVAMSRAQPPRSYQLLMRAIDRPHAAARIVVLSFMLALPAIAGGLTMDDYVIEAAVRRDPWSAFEFTPRDPIARAKSLNEARADGGCPWWADPQREQAFLRPLASLTHAIDFRYWPRALWLMHLENVVLFAVIVWLAGQIYTLLGLSRPVLALATFFFAMSANLSQTVGWLSGRNTLLGAAFGACAIWLELRSRAGAARLALQLMAAASLAAGLLCSEFAAGAAGFLLAHLLIFRHGPVVRRFVAFWPYAIVLAAWQVVYIAGGYRVIGSGFHHGPLQEPWLFTRGVLTGLPIYIATQLLAPIATVSVFYRSGLAVVTAISLVILFMMRGLLTPLLRADRRARFLLLGAALATVPLGATGPQERLAFFVSLGVAAIVALIVSERFDDANRTLSRRGAASLFRIHGLYLPVLFIPMLFAFAHAGAAGRGTDLLAAALPRSNEHGVVLVNAPSEMLPWYQRYIRAHRGLPALPSLDPLYAGGRPVEVRRTSDRSLEVDVSGGWFNSMFERTLRNPDRCPFHPNDVVEHPRFRVTVLAVDSGAPMRVRVDFPAPLEQLPLEWLAWRDRGPEPWPLPSIGGRASFPALPPFP